MFWARFEDLCAKIGKAPNAVAKELKIPSGSVTAWKKGSTPRNETLVKIAAYFDVSIDYLSGKGQKETPTASGEGLDPTTKELFELVESASDSERKMMLEMLRVLKRGGK